MENIQETTPAVGVVWARPSSDLCSSLL